MYVIHDIVFNLFVLVIDLLSIDIHVCNNNKNIFKTDMISQYTELT